MKEGISLPDLATELERQVKSKRDFIAQRKVLAVKDHGSPDAIKFRIGTNGSTEWFGLAETGHDQLAERLQIPKPYYDRMRSQYPGLLAANINTWLEHTKDERSLVRTLDGRVRGVLGPRYRPLDCYDLAQAVLPIFAKEEMEVVSSALTDKHLYIKATTPKLKAEIRPGDVVQFGLIVRNSEIGYSSLSILDMVYRLVCSNGAISETAFRRRHVGRQHEMGDLEEAYELYTDATRKLDDQAFWSKIKDVVTARISEDNFQAQVDKLKGATKREIDNPVTVVELTAERFKLPEDDEKNVLKFLAKGGDLTQYGLGNAITAYSQTVPDYERATELEKLGGQIFELTDSDWEVLNKKA